MAERGTRQDGTMARLEGLGQRDRRSTPWSPVIDPRALEREIRIDGTAPDDVVQATSPEDERRHAWLRRYAEGADGPGLYRPEIIADEPMIERLRALKTEVPNGAAVIEVMAPVNPPA